MNIDELAEEMGIDIFCKGCRLMPIDCVCGFTEKDFMTQEELEAEGDWNEEPEIPFEIEMQ